ncbi:ORF6N domain-containing protein, partial [Escherichia coli]|nr:ORF6N domain-containing protein [Escherichia coli]
MKTLPTVNTLQPILHNQLPVITTELLAQLYGTERQRLTNNFNRNKERFIEGKHFFRIEGKELRELKNKNSLRVPVRVVNEPSLRGLQIPPKVRSLILW